MAKQKRDQMKCPACANPGDLCRRHRVTDDLLDDVCKDAVDWYETTIGQIEKGSPAWVLKAKATIEFTEGGK